MIALNGQGKTRGTVAVLKTEATCNQSIVALTPKYKAKLNYMFLFYYLRSAYQELRNLTGDKERSGLSMRMLRPFPVLIPPIETQNKIADKLDKQMAQIEMMKKEAEKQLQTITDILESILSYYLDKKIFIQEVLWSFQIFVIKIKDKYIQNRKKLKGSNMWAWRISNQILEK